MICSDGKSFPECSADKKTFSTNIANPENSFGNPVEDNKPDSFGMVEHNEKEIYGKSDENLTESSHFTSNFSDDTKGTKEKNKGNEENKKLNLYSSVYPEFVSVIQFIQIFGPLLGIPKVPLDILEDGLDINDTKQLYYEGLMSYFVT